MFWTLCILASLAAVALVTRPWWQPTPAASGSRRRSANLRAYELRLAELEADAAAGTLEARELAAARDEAGTRLLQDADASPAQEPAAEGRGFLSRGPGIALAVLIPAFALAWYAAQGSWRTQDLIAKAQTDPEQARAQAVENMVAGLAQRLQKEPDDLEGWKMLGRSYFVLERYSESAKAYAQANMLGGSGLGGSEDPDVLVAEGEALALSRDRDLAGRPAALFGQALEIAPDHGRALWYGGLAAAQEQRYADALSHWQRLLAQPDLPEDLRGNLGLRIAELEKLSGQKAPKELKGPKAAVAASPLQLRVRVSISPELAGRVTPGHTLFVFAKAAQGPPMPLAVQRIAAPHLPLEVTLDDSMAMMPSLKLSQFERWTLSARLSASGQAQAAPGDLQGEKAVARADAGKPVDLVIRDIAP